MKNININQSIWILSTLSRYGIVLAMAILCGKICWWIANPLGYNSTSNISSGAKVSNQETITAGIVNRAPFGVVRVEVAVQPTIVDQVKLVGVYAGGPKSSIAFLEISGKNTIAQIGDAVLDAKLKSVSPTGIVLQSGNQNVNINLSAGNLVSSNLASSPMPSRANNNGTQPSSLSPEPALNQGNNSANLNNPNKDSSHDEDSIAEKRRKMIEAFQKQNSENPPQ